MGEGHGISPPRVGGCLAGYWLLWQTAGAEPWVVSVLRDGYRIPFIQGSFPPLARSPVLFRTYRPESPKSLALAQEILKMMDKGALEIVRDPDPGFYSRLFLVEKVTGGWRPVIDLSRLNVLIRQTPFKMETMATTMASVREGDFLASVDLKDAYFQIPVHQESRKFLRFFVGGVVYQFKVLCFGLSTAPQVFTRVFDLISKWVHARGIRLLRYLDDWPIMGSSEPTVRQHIWDLLSFCHSLGIVINEEKSDLVPMQRARYLGMEFDTVAARIYPTVARVDKFLTVAERFLLLESPQLSSGRLSSDIWHR